MTSQIEAILARLARLHPKLIDLSLGRVERLLDALDHPERALPPVVHVAGTNGKGSLIAYLHAMLAAAGYRVHVYTSPHLIDFNERIVLDGAPIEDGLLAALLEECEAANRGAPITFFEITTAAAMLAFARTPADILLLETGLGGRLDATNVVARPRLCALTPISLDHQHFLGDTLAEIAAEKAAILKPGVPAVSAPQPPEAAAVIAAHATKIGAPLSAHGREWSFEANADGLTYVSGSHRIALAKPALAGSHQLENAALAVACAERLDGFDIPAAALARAVATATWPGRLQRLEASHFATHAAETADIWLDGGHNPAAAAALAETARAWTERSLHLVVGMMNGKDPAAFLGPLVPVATALWAVPIPGEANAHAPAALAEAAQAVGIEAHACDGVTAAIEAITAASPRSRILICGSLYLAGHVLAQQRYALSA